MGKRRAFSSVSSRQPVSTKTISSTKPSREARHSSMKVDSSRTMSVAETRMQHRRKGRLYAYQVLLGCVLLGCMWCSSLSSLSSLTKPEPFAVSA